MKLTLLISILLFLAPKNTWAFDRIYCQSDLKGWIVSLTEATQAAVLTPKNQNAKLSESQSQKLVVIGLNVETIITIFPWNSLYVRIPDETKAKYDVISKESAAGFSIEIIDKKSKLSRFMDCSFTF